MFAIYIELVSDLITNAFTAAFKCFISQKEILSYVFIQLYELYKFYTNQQAQLEIEQFMCNKGISWNFIPLNALHFGGLWEAAIKSAKFHMVWIVGKAHLIFKETQTILYKIEMILN